MQCVHYSHAGCCKGPAVLPDSAGCHAQSLTVARGILLKPFRSILPLASDAHVFRAYTVTQRLLEGQ